MNLGGLAMIGSGLTVGENPWLACALWWTVRVHLLGLAWSWAAVPAAGRDGRRLPWMPAALLAPCIGLALNMLAAVMLAEAGLYTPMAEAGVLAALAGTGLVLGRARLRVLPHVPVALATLTAAMAAMWLPDRGECIDGGQDQGIYVNQGVAVSRSGTFHPPPDPLLSVLTDEELEIFTRRVHNYTEYLATIPVDPESRRIVHFFFRGTPAMVAVADRCGGLRAATRVNLLLGWPVLLTFSALIGVLYGRWVPVLAGSLILITHPVFVFLLHLPTSEMLQTLLVTGVLVLLAASPPAGRPVAAAGIGLFAAMVNRFSFFPFGALLAAGWAWSHSGGAEADRRGLLSGAGMLAAGLILGLGFDLWRCPVPIGRLDELTLPVLIAGGGLLAAALGMAASPALQRAAARLPPNAVLAGVPTVALVLILYEPFAGGTSHVDLVGNLRGILPYFSVGAVALALLGLGMACRPGSALSRRTGWVLAFLAAGALLSLAVAAISRLYPWALRRQLIYTIPCLALLGAHAAQGLWDAPRRAALARTLLGILLTAGAVQAARLSRQAALATDFNGLSEIVAQIAEQLPPDAVVVADHFRWSTPLRMLHGVPVLNGEVLWADFDADRMGSAMQALERLQRAGWDVQFLTSTSEGLAPYRGMVEGARLRWESGPVDLADVHDHPSQSGFRLQARTKEFRLYDWP